VGLTITTVGIAVLMNKPENTIVELEDDAEKVE
jgi:hypothetical protein